MEFLRRFKRRLTAKLLPPKLVYGYLGSDGVYRPRVRISNTSILHRPENIYLEDNVFIGHYTYLDGSARLTVGEGTQLAAWAGILTHSSHLALRYYGDAYLEVPEAQKAHFVLHPTSIGKFSFLGAKSLVLPGVRVGDGTLIAAGALVETDVPDFAIVRGSPAVQVGDTRELDERVFGDLPATYYLRYLGRLEKSDV